MKLILTSGNTFDIPDSDLDGVINTKLQYRIYRYVRSRMETPIITLRSQLINSAQEQMK